jgi:hypothetical protein
MPGSLAPCSWSIVAEALRSRTLFLAFKVVRFEGSWQSLKTCHET